jgi:ribosomal-protein-alanine N-acetyltransferase
MTSPFEVRPITLEDAAALHHACFAQSTVDAVRELVQRGLERARRERGLGMVAVSGAAVIGYGQLTLWPRAAEISDLIVTPALRNRGVGTAIITALLAQCHRLHITKVEIGAALDNPRAIALYRRLGFHEERIITLDLGDGPQPVIYLAMPVERSYALSVPDRQPDAVCAAASGPRR